MMLFLFFTIHSQNVVVKIYTCVRHAEWREHSPALSETL